MINNVTEYLGSWWVSETDKVEGVLKVTSEIIELFLIGTFGTPKESQKKFQEVNVINGFTTNGKKVTLINCIQISFGINMPGMFTSTYSASLMIEGNNYQSESDIYLQNISASYDHLAQWISISPFRVENNLQNKELLVNYKKLQDQEVEISGLIVGIKSTFRTSGNMFESLTLEQTPWISFSTLGGFSFIEGLETVNKIAQFLTLCTSHYIRPIRIEALDKEGDKITILFPQKEEKVTKRKTHNDFLVLYGDITENLQKYLQIWRDKSELFEPILNYFVDAHRKEIFTEISFLKLVQCLEVFSRRMRKNLKIEKKEYDAKVNTILNSIQHEEEKEWLNEILRYANEPNLGNRLKGLFKETKFLLNLNSKQIDSFVYKIVETRNYLTHFDESKKDKTLDIGEMFYLGQYFILILRVLILKELGFDEEFVKARVGQNKSIGYIKSGLNL